MLEARSWRLEAGSWRLEVRGLTACVLELLRFPVEEER
jgi:hypothetical protein